MIDFLPNWHPIFVHFSVGLLTLATIFFVTGFVARKASWASGIIRAGYWNLWSGALITILTIAAGLYGYFTVGQEPSIHEFVEDHRNWGIATAVLFWGAAIWTIRNKLEGAPLLLVVVMLLGTAVMTVAGYKGGELVYRYGLGVQGEARLPRHSRVSQRPMTQRMCPTPFAGPAYGVAFDAIATTLGIGTVLQTVATDNR